MTYPTIMFCFYELFECSKLEALIETEKDNFTVSDVNKLCEIHSLGNCYLETGTITSDICPPEEYQYSNYTEGMLRGFFLTEATLKVKNSQLQKIRPAIDERLHCVYMREFDWFRPDRMSLFR